MKAKEIEECENCPLLGNHCSGGTTSTPGGTPIEPPCCSWNPDDEISEDEMDIEVARQEQEREKQWEYEERLRIKKKEKKKRIRESRLHIYSEAREINRLKRNYKGLAKLKSLASAFSVASEIMREPKDNNVEVAKSNIEIEMENILLEIESIKAIKKQKLKELRNKRRTLK